MSNERGNGAVYWLWEEEQEVGRSIERRTEDIERLEAQIVAERAKRDELRLVAVEMRVARQLIESANLKVERRGAEVHVSIDPPPVDPARLADALEATLADAVMAGPSGIRELGDERTSYWRDRAEAVAAQYRNGRKVLV